MMGTLATDGGAGAGLAAGELCFDCAPVRLAQQNNRLKQNAQSLMMKGTLFLSPQFPNGKGAGKGPCSTHTNNRLTTGKWTRETAPGKQSLA
jgi:hypothetical protein